MSKKIGVVDWAVIIFFVAIVLNVLIMLFGPLIAEGVSPAIWLTIINLYPAMNFIGGIAFLVIIIGGIYRLFMRIKTKPENLKIDPQTGFVDITELSSQEKQAIQIISKAKTRPLYDISDALQISTEEAIELLKNIRKKLGVNTNEELIKHAEEKGLINNI